MGFKFIASILLCGAGIITITGHNTAGAERLEATAEVVEFAKETSIAIPARFVYIQFPGEDSKMIQLQHVGSIISQRLTQPAIPGSWASN